MKILIVFLLIVIIVLLWKTRCQCKGGSSISTFFENYMQGDPITPEMCDKNNPESALDPHCSSSPITSTSMGGAVRGDISNSSDIGKIIGGYGTFFLPKPK